MPCTPMPDGTPRGSCCFPATGNLSPFLPCSSCFTEEQCYSMFDVNIPILPPLHDCRPWLREALDDWGGSPYTFIVEDVRTGFGHRVLDTNEFHIFNDVLTDELLDNIWHEGVTCNELNDGRTPYRPCGLGGACCFDACPYRPDSHGCLPYNADVCHQGYTIGRANILYQVVGAPAWRVIREGCAFRKPLNDSCPELVATTDVGAFVLCQCSYTISPFIANELRDLGFHSCVLLPQDTRTWEEGCADIRPIDLFPCRTLGIPLTIDNDGFAAFDVGDRRVAPEREGCTYPLADLYVDADGFAHSVACTQFNDAGVATEAAIDNLHQDTCAAMYGDYRWDEQFDC